MRKQTAAIQLAVCVAAVSGAGANATVVHGQGTWETTLEARDLNHDGTTDAYYDTVLNISWLADFSYPMTHLGAGSGLIWQGAMDAAARLNVLGVTGWRLPTLSPINGTSFQYGRTNNGSTDIGTAWTDLGWGKNSELGHLFYVTLGNRGFFIPDDSSPAIFNGPQPGWTPDPNSGPFQNVVATGYWTDTKLRSAPDVSMMFNWSTGYQSDDSSEHRLWSAFVRDGDVALVPEPTTTSLLLVGLCGLLAALRGRARRAFTTADARTASYAVI